MAGECRDQRGWLPGSWVLSTVPLRGSSLPYQTNKSGGPENFSHPAPHSGCLLSGVRETGSDPHVGVITMLSPEKQIRSEPKEPRKGRQVAFFGEPEGQVALKPHSASHSANFLVALPNPSALISPLPTCPSHAGKSARIIPGQHVSAFLQGQGQP